MEDLFKCPQCEVICGNKSNLLTHVDKHEGYPLSCIKCHSDFKNKFAFDYHLVAELCKKPKKHVRQLRQCPECPQTFPNSRHFTKHVEGHKRNNCQYCGARLTTRKELTLHLAQEHKIKLQKAKYQCQFCERCFVKQVTLFNHYNHHANGKFVCQGCGLFLDTKEEFETHRERHEQERPWKCTRCATTFSRRQQYIVHMESHEKYQCGTCSMGFAAKATLQEHTRACQNQSGKESRHECPECGKIFSRQGQLRLHLRSHTGEEAYTCLACKKSFQSAQGYNQHIQSSCHQNKDDPKRPFECDQCRKHFPHEYLLVEHVNRMHGAARSYKCTFCDHTSNNMANMTRHLALHTERRRFVCEQCGAAFHSHNTLKDHCTSVHSQQRHFRCSTCRKTFKLHSDLRRHIRSHSDTRPFKCQNCNQAYKRASHLRRHEETTHGTVFKPRRLQRLGHDETGALVPIVEESGSGVKKEPPPVVVADKQWTPPTTSQNPVFANPVLSLVDADSGKVITLQELWTVSDAQILTTTGDLSTSEVLTLPPDDPLTTIVTCADGTTFDSFQSGEVVQAIEVTYDLTFPTSQPLTTVLSSSEPRLVFATPITMSLDPHQKVLTVSEVHSSDNLNDKVQLLEAHDASKLSDSIFIEHGKLDGLEEPMLLDGTEPAPHITIENFTALDDRSLQSQVIDATSDSALALSNLPSSVETILQLPTSADSSILPSSVETILQLPTSADSSILPKDILTSGSLLRERLMSGPKQSSSRLPAIPLLQPHCSNIPNGDLDNSVMSSSSVPCTIAASVSARNVQHDHGISNLSISSPVSNSSDDSHLNAMISIPDTVQSSYANISVESIHPESVMTSLSIPNSIHSPPIGCTNVISSISRLSIPNSVQNHHSGVSIKDARASVGIPTISISESICTTRLNKSTALTVSTSIDGTGTNLPTGDIHSNALQHLCSNVSDNINCNKSALSILSIPNSLRPSDSDMEGLHPNAPGTVQHTCPDHVDTLSVDALEAGIHPSCTISIQPQDCDMSIEPTHTDLVMALPLTAEEMHSNSSLSQTVHSSCSNESPTSGSSMMPDFLPQNFQFLNVE